MDGAVTRKQINLALQGGGAHGAFTRLSVHIIENQEALNPLGSTTKMNAEWRFLRHLHDIGRETAAGWLDEHFEAVGERSTVDLRSMFEGSGAEHHG